MLPINRENHGLHGCHGSANPFIRVTRGTIRPKRCKLRRVQENGFCPQVGQALAAGANVNTKDENGKSVMGYGRRNKNAKVFAELIKAGAK